MEANATAIVDSPTGIVRSIRWQSRISAAARPQPSKEHSTKEDSTPLSKDRSKDPDHEDMTLLPTGPTTVTWTLAPPGTANGLPESLAKVRRRLGTNFRDELPHSKFISTSLSHGDMAISLKDLKKDPQMRSLSAETACSVQELDRVLEWVRSGDVQRWKNDGELVHTIHKLALCPPRDPDWDPAAVVPLLRAELLQHTDCLSSSPRVCAVLLNSLGLIDSLESHDALAAFTAQARSPIFDQKFVAVIAGLQIPSPSLLGALAGARQLRRRCSSCPLQHCIAATLQHCNTATLQHAIVELVGTPLTPTRRCLSCTAHLHAVRTAVVLIASVLYVCAGRLNNSNPTLQLARDAHTHLLMAAASAAASLNESVWAASPEAASVFEQAASLGESDLRTALESIHSAVREELRASALTDAAWREMHVHAESTTKGKWAAMGHEQRITWVSHHAGMDPTSLELESEANYAQHEAHALDMLRHEHLVRHPEYSALGEERATNQIIAALRAAHNLANDSHADLCTSFLDHHHHDVASAAAKALVRFPSDQVEDSLLQQLTQRLPTGMQKSGSAGARQNSTMARNLISALIARESTGAEATMEATKQLMRLPFHLPTNEADTHVTVCIRNCVPTCNPRLKLKRCRQQCTDQCGDECEVANALRELTRKGLGQHGNQPLNRALAEHSEEIHPSLVDLHHRRLDVHKRRKLGLLDGVEGFFGMIKDATDQVKAGVADWASDPYVKMDYLDLNQFSLTFLDLVLTHTPIEWSKFWGDRDLIPVWGGAGVSAELAIRNSAFLRVGLFGGGFGVDLYNLARIDGELLKWNVKIFFAEFAFKFTR